MYQRRAVWCYRLGTQSPRVGTQHIVLPSFKEDWTLKVRSLRSENQEPVWIQFKPSQDPLASESVAEKFGPNWSSTTSPMMFSAFLDRLSVPVTFNGTPRNPKHLGREQLANWQRSCSRCQPLSVITYNSYLCTVFSCFLWYYCNGRCWKIYKVHKSPRFHHA